MNWLDILILAALIISTIGGLMQGLIRAALTLAGLIVGVILAGRFYEPLSRLLGFIPDENAANIVAFVLILVVVMVVAMLLATLLRSIAKATIILGWLDRIGGAVFGFLIGAISWSAILAIWVKFFGSDLVASSFLAQVLLDKFPLILGLLPGEFDAIRDFFQ
jgi:membrane protein required for colicin V production